MLDGARLEVSADVDGDGTKENGVFELPAGPENDPRDIQDSNEPNFLLGGRGSRTNAVLSGFQNRKDAREQGVFFGLGAGTRLVSLQFALHYDGTYTWGDTSASGLPGDATGEDPVTQKDVLLKYLVQSDSDSLGDTYLHYHNWSQSGIFEPLKVAVRDRQFSQSTQDASIVTGSLTLAHAADLTEAWDAADQTPD